ncbi:MAG: hypothetical protein KAJ92_06255 [Gammaproteobacteria bacterium]|nr:hypothetical protein [Gammaproteobacteria bacterium]MCK5263269.1 hypothetical protein [Gammaproteobacteria bacterium]
MSEVFRRKNPELSLSDVQSVTILGGQGKAGQKETVSEVRFEMGSVVSIVGSTGSGKTALINDIELFANTNTPTSRKVLINGATPPADLVWCITGMMDARDRGIEIGYYHILAYEGMVRQTQVELQLGRRYDFLPRFCMLQARHSGLINTMIKTNDGYRVRLEGIGLG